MWVPKCSFVIFFVVFCPVRVVARSRFGTLFNEIWWNPSGIRIPFQYPISCFKISYSQETARWLFILCLHHSKILLTAWQEYRCHPNSGAIGTLLHKSRDFESSWDLTIMGIIERAGNRKKEWLQQRWDFQDKWSLVEAIPLPRAQVLIKATLLPKAHVSFLFLIWTMVHI